MISKPSKRKFHMNSSESRLTLPCSSLSTDILTLFVGPKRQKILIHWTMLQKAAPIVRDMSFFKTSFQDATIDEPTKIAYIPKDHHEAFEQLCYWIYRKGLPKFEFSLPTLDARKARVITSIKLYQLSIKFGILELQTSIGHRLDSEIGLKALESDEVLEFLRDADPNCRLRNHILKWICYQLLPFGSPMDGDWISTFLKSYPTVAVAILLTFKTSLYRHDYGFRMDLPVFDRMAFLKTSYLSCNTGSLQIGEGVSGNLRPSGGFFGGGVTGEPVRGATGIPLFGEGINMARDAVGSNAERSISSISTLPSRFESYSAEVTQFSKTSMYKS